jgi:signal transduction histidine kinase
LVIVMQIPLSTAVSAAPATDLAAVMAETARLRERLAESEALLAEARAHLTESPRLATVGTIAAVIAHEFNNLLTPIASYSQLALNGLEAGKDDPEMVRKALSKSVTHAMRAGKICTSMLSLVRGERDNRTVAIQTLVDETLSVLARDPSRDGIALRVQVQPDLNVKGDPIQLEQVLLNLLINARQAMLQEHDNGRGGVLTIKAGRAEDTIRIDVADTGPGIAERNLPRIFEPFFTTKTAPRAGEPRGSGLGLHICKQIVEKHGGRIEVESAPGRGTTFGVLLPAA